MSKDYGCISWYSVYFSNDGVCALCSKQYSSESGNRKKHITLQHNLVEEVKLHMDAEAKKKELSGKKNETGKNQTLMTAFLQKPSIPELPRNENVLMFFATTFQPYALVENHFFAEITNSLTERYRVPCRQTLSSQMSKYALQKLKSAVELLARKDVTLAFDSGTIWRRYLVCVAVTNDLPPLLLSAVCNTEFEDGRFTSLNVASFMQRCIEMLPPTARVVGLVCDNAQSMQKAMRIVKITEQIQKVENEKPPQEEFVEHAFDPSESYFVANIEDEEFADHEVTFEEADEEEEEEEEDDGNEDKSKGRGTELYQF